MTQRASETRKDPPIEDEAADPTRPVELYAAMGECAERPDAVDRLHRLCQGAVELLAVTGVAVTLTSSTPSLTGTLITLHSTDEMGRWLGDLQHATGQGPSSDAARLGRPVAEPDLAAHGPERWPHLTEAASDAGIAALFSFPLQLDRVTTGTLDGHRDEPGPLDDAQLADGRALAALVLRELSHPSSAGALELDPRVGGLSPDRALIEQATGMVAAQRATSIAEAAQRLRAYARDHRRATIDVARNILEGRLRLD